MKAISTAIASAGAWITSTALVGAGVAPPPAVDTESGNEGVLLLALIGVVIFAVTKGKSKAVDDGAPTVVDDASGAGDGKY